MIERDSSAETLAKYSHDTSIFEVKPKEVVFPKSSLELQELVSWAKESDESITVRAAGTDMTGGPLSESVVADVTKYMNRIGEIENNTVTVGPGVFYRDLESQISKFGLMLPCFPASKSLCAIGGMIGNNCAGEKTLRYGKMENFILESKWIFADGREYTIKPGVIDNEYSQKVFDLVTSNWELITSARPKVSKNSAGYYLWNVWDGETFDLNKLLVGSQGTLGIMTEAKLRFVPIKKHHDLIALFFRSWDELPQVVNAILPHEPESLETFDEETIKLGIRFMPEIARRAHTGLMKFALQFLPEAVIGAKMHGLPKLVVLVEVTEESESEVKRKVNAIRSAIEPFKIFSRVVEKDTEEEKFWVMRRESFNLLREHVKGKRTAPFIEDFCIPPESVPEFLPQALQILKNHNIDVNIAGHAGNGNFHIIPLMDLSQKSEREKIVQVADKFYDLVARYHGTTTGEHNDGIIRTPYLGKIYSPEVLELFRQVKHIFDPQNIFNPGKKVGGSIEYLKTHISSHT